MTLPNEAFEPLHAIAAATMRDAAALARTCQHLLSGRFTVRHLGALRQYVEAGRSRAEEVRAVVDRLDAATSAGYHKARQKRQERKAAASAESRRRVAEWQAETWAPGGPAFTKAIDDLSEIREVLADVENVLRSPRPSKLLIRSLREHIDALRVASSAFTNRSPAVRDRRLAREEAKAEAILRSIGFGKYGAAPSPPPRPKPDEKLIQLDDYRS